MPWGSTNGEMGIGSMSGASRFGVKYLFDASNTLPCVALVSTQASSEASGKFRSNIPYISCALTIASLNVLVP